MSVQNYLQARADFAGEVVELDACLSVLQGHLHNMKAHPGETVVLNTEVVFPSASVQWAMNRINGRYWPSVESLARQLLAFQIKRQAMKDAWGKLTPEQRVGIPRPCNDRGM